MTADKLILNCRESYDSKNGSKTDIRDWWTAERGGMIYVYCRHVLIDIVTA